MENLDVYLALLLADRPIPLSRKSQLGLTPRSLATFT